MQIFRLATFWPILTVSILLAFILGCQKDFHDDHTKINNTDDRAITLDDVMAKYGASGGTDRSGERLPLCVTPLWDEAYVVTNMGFPIIMTPVDTPVALPGTRFGGSLAFYKDPAGSIQSKLVLWAADSLSSYFPNRAPLDATGNFNGTMILVSQEDTIEKFVKVTNGILLGIF